MAGSQAAVREKLAGLSSILGNAQKGGDRKTARGGELVVSDEVVTERMIAQARAGDEAALAALLELYRNYLRLVARSMIGPALRVKLEPSDLVQETFLKAHREFAGFAGESERELVAWLRRILARTLADQVKHHRRKGRNYQQEESLDLLLERSDQTLTQALASHSGSPSERASHREQAVLLADAVSQLPADYREVFILRTLEHVPFDEIAAKMGRSVGAVRMLWARALERLNRLLENEA
jgi:RNA polymerase sigma-70 factor (ECF subfamily)